MKWFCFLLVMLWAAILVVGCTEDNSSNENNPIGPTGELTADEMTETQIDEVVNQGIIFSAQQNLEIATRVKLAFSDNSPNPNALPQNRMIEWPTISDPEPGWEGPDVDGWYTKTDIQYYDFSKVRLTPDIWADQSGPLTMLQYYLGYTEEIAGGSISYIWDYEGRTINDRTAIDGSYIYSKALSYEVDGEELGYSYDWDMLWSLASLEENNHSGHYESSTLYPIFDQTGYLMVALTTELDFDADAIGSGTGWIASEEYVRFTFTGMHEFGYIEGYYTLKTDDWQMQHPLTFL
jgi:hypothetical protein